MNITKNGKTALMLFFFVTASAALGSGFSESILANYYKDVFDATASQRAFVEFPRELPGVMCVFVLSALTFISDLRLTLIAQILTACGIMTLGFITPSFNIMLIYLFIFSFGMHLYLPLADSLGLRFAESDKVGVRVGQYGSVKTGCTFLSGVIIFIAFRSGFFSFASEVKLPFIFSGVFYFISAALVLLLCIVVKGEEKQEVKRAKFKLSSFKKEYRYYYMLTILHGVQKQIAMVFGSWAIIELLGKGADTMSLLIILGSFLSMIFFRFIGKWIDERGIRFVMFLDALSFIIIYVLFGVVVWLLSENILEASSWVSMTLYALFVLDRLSMQVGVVKSVYLRKIALCPEDVTQTISAGFSLDHIVSITTAQISGLVWVAAGPQWVFFIAAFFSLGNLFVASKMEKGS